MGTNNTPLHDRMITVAARLLNTDYVERANASKLAITLFQRTSIQTVRAPSMSALACTRQPISYIRMCEPLGGGWTLTGGAFLAATYMRELRLAKGVSAME